MNTEQIKKGIELFNSESKIQNKTLKYTSIGLKLFLHNTGSTSLDFIRGINTHPFVMVRGCIMLKNI
jgi:hypothetical protein